MFALPARRHDLSFRQSVVLCVKRGQEVSTFGAWLGEPCVRDKPQVQEDEAPQPDPA